MADELTPYYQERLRWLSAQQRQVVELLCSHPSPLSPSEVARQLLAPENSIGAQFKRLTQLKYVKRSQRGRESLYELTEPLMRLASEVKERKPLRLLVGFLRVWYQPERLSQMLQTTNSESLRAHLVLAIEEALSSPDPQLAAIQANIEWGQEDGGINELIQALEDKVQVTSAPEDWVELGLCLLKAQRYEEALPCLDKALALDPEAGPAWTAKGLALSSLQRYEEALPCLDKALALDPEASPAWTAKGAALGALQRYEEALPCLDKALALDPEASPAWTAKGAALGNLQRYEEALSCLDKALALDPEASPAWTAKGLALVSLQHYEEALPCLDKALALDPEASLAWSIKGAALHNLRRYEEALACYAEALSIDPNDAPASFSLAEEQFALNRWQDGFSALDKALSLDKTEVFRDTALMITFIQRSAVDEWEQHVTSIIGSYQKPDALSR